MQTDKKLLVTHKSTFGLVFLRRRGLHADFITSPLPPLHLSLAGVFRGADKVSLDLYHYLIPSDIRSGLKKSKPWAFR